MQNEIVRDLFESVREHKKNIYYNRPSKIIKQRSPLTMENSTMIKDIKIDQLSYQDLKTLDDEHLKIALDYLHEKYGGQRPLSKYLNIAFSTLNTLEKKRNYKFSGTYKTIKNLPKTSTNTTQEKNNAAHISKIEYEIMDTNSSDIKNVINLFLNQVDEIKKYNLFFKIVQSEEK